jgi:hypothetical protein
MSEVTARSRGDDAHLELLDDVSDLDRPPDASDEQPRPKRHGHEAPEPEQCAETESRAHLRLDKLRRLWVISIAFLALQAALLIGWSTFQAHRFALGTDFSTYNQGAWLIAHGHLDPWSTVDGFSFARDHFTLLMWPISMMYALVPHPTTLLILQDLASAGAGLVAIRWILEILELRLRTTSGALGLGVVAVIVGVALIAVVLDPWVWQADSFDFHMEAFSALLIVLASRDFWRHRPQRALLWCGLTLLSSDLGGLLVIGLALSVLAAAIGFRRWGVVALALGVTWTGTIHGLGFAHGSNLAGYSALVYSAPKTGPVTMFDLVRALAVHPTRVYWAVKEKSGLVYENLVPTGFLGLVNPWTFGVTIVVLSSTALMGPSIFLQSGFQSIPAYALGLAGTVLTVVSILTHGDPRGHRRFRRVAAAVIGAMVLAQVLGLAAVMLPRTSSNWVRVSGSQADTLGAVLAATPQNAQVIVSDGVMGRFSGREQVEPIPWWGGTAYPIRSREVIFVVVPEAGIESLAPTDELQVMHYVRDVLQADPITTANGVYAFRWHPGPTVHSLTLPG